MQVVFSKGMILIQPSQSPALNKRDKNIIEKELNLKEDGDTIVLKRINGVPSVHDSNPFTLQSVPVDMGAINKAKAEEKKFVGVSTIEKKSTTKGQ